METTIIYWGYIVDKVLLMFNHIVVTTFVDSFVYRSQIGPTSVKNLLYN